MIDDETGMGAALEMATAALKLGELPVGAAIVSAGVVVAKAHTRERSDARFLVHAELNALLAFDLAQPTIQERRRAVLFTTVEPCLMCFGAAMSAFVGRVVYSLRASADGATEHLSGWNRNENGFAGYQVPSVTGGVNVSESRRLFQEYITKTADGAVRRWAQSVFEG